MKKFKVFFVMLMLMFVTGCYNVNLNMSINDDKSMDFTMIQTVDNTNIETNSNEVTEDSAIESSYSSNFSETKENMGARGYTVDDNYVDPDNPNIKGIKITRKFNNIDSISKEGEAIRVNLSNLSDKDFDDKVFFTVKKGLVYNTYTATFIFGEEDATDAELAQMKQFDNLINAVYTVNLPVKPISSNSTNISNDGKTLSWDLKISDVSKIEYSFKMADKMNLYMAYGSIGLIVLLILTAIGVAIGNKKRKKRSVPKPPKEKKKKGKEKVDINKNIDLMAPQGENGQVNLMAPQNPGNVNLMTSTPEMNTMQNTEVKPLHSEDGPAVNIDAPAMTINVNGESEQVIAPTTIDLNTNQLPVLEQEPVNNPVLEGNPDGFKDMNPEDTKPTIIKPVDNSVIVNEESNEKPQEVSESTFNNSFTIPETIPTEQEQSGMSQMDVPVMEQQPTVENVKPIEIPNVEQPMMENIQPVVEPQIEQKQQEAVVEIPNMEQPMMENAQPTLEPQMEDNVVEIPEIDIAQIEQKQQEAVVEIPNMEQPMMENVQPVEQFLPNEEIVHVIEEPVEIPSMEQPMMENAQPTSEPQMEDNVVEIPQVDIAQMEQSQQEAVVEIPNMEQPMMENVQPVIPQVEIPIVESIQPVEMPNMEQPIEQVPVVEIPNVDVPQVENVQDNTMEYNFDFNNQTLNVEQNIQQPIEQTQQAPVGDFTNVFDFNPTANQSLNIPVESQMEQPIEQAPVVENVQPVEMPQVEIPNIDVPQVENIQPIEMPQVEIPNIDVPQVENAQPVEMPQVEIPQIDSSQIQIPQAEVQIEEQAIVPEFQPINQIVEPISMPQQVEVQEEAPLANQNIDLPVLPDIPDTDPGMEQKKHATITNVEIPNNDGQTVISDVVMEPTDNQN